MSDQRTVRLEFSGDLDVFRRDEFASAFPPPETIDRLAIDLRNATLLDSSIVAVLMRYRRGFIDAGGDARDIVVVVPPNLRRIFEITGLVTLLTVVTAAPGSKEPLAEA